MDLNSFQILIVFFTAWIALYAVSRVVSLDKYGLEIHSLYMIYRTKRLDGFLSILARKYQKLGRVFWNIGVAVAIGEMILATYLLLINLFHFIYIPHEAQRFFLLLPGITISLKWIPYLLIAAGLAVTTHELSHGIAAHYERVNIDSSGITMTPIFFGAFVEPNEDQFKKKSFLSKSRIVSAGSLTNLVIGILVTLLMLGVFTSPSGVIITGLRENGPAYDAGIREWDVIQVINGTTIRNVSDLQIFMSKVKPGDTIIVATLNGFWHVVTTTSSQDSNYTSLGIGPLIDYIPLRFGGFSVSMEYQLFQILNWISLLTINLAIFNMMPLYPMDGDAFISLIFEKKLKHKTKILRVVLSVFSLSLIAINIGFSFIEYGFAPI